MFRQGDPADGLYGVVSGTLALDVTRADSGPFRLHLFQRADWVGETVLFDDRPRNYTVTATEAASLLHLTLDDLDRIAACHPDLWRWLAVLSALHLELAISAYCDLVTTRTIERLAAILLRLFAVRTRSGLEDPRSIVNVTQGDLALMAGVSRATIGNELQQLEESGSIECGYGSIRLKDPRTLAAIADGEVVRRDMPDGRTLIDSG